MNRLCEPLEVRNLGSIGPEECLHLGVSGDQNHPALWVRLPELQRKIDAIHFRRVDIADEQV